MSNDFGSDFITVSDEDGNDFVLEHVDTIEVDNTYYLAFLPTDMDEEDDEYGLIILKAVDEDGEEILVSIDDDSLLDDLCERFIERMVEED
ncbi:MAG: DUF1292 domain-containing protein [Oscillospiraceae bacterium]|nr:DUF1292 domain-containing protein [Oscillospiraceae bacterium]